MKWSFKRLLVLFFQGCRKLFLKWDGKNENHYALLAKMGGHNSFLNQFNQNWVENGSFLSFHWKLGGQLCTMLTLINTTPLWVLPLHTISYEKSVKKLMSNYPNQISFMWMLFRTSINTFLVHFEIFNWSSKVSFDVILDL